MSNFVLSRRRATHTSGYIDVDLVPDPHAYVRRLDGQGRTAFWQAIKLQTYQLLELQSGASVLDVGCGTGDDARALAAIVGPNGQVIGVDRSKTMIAEARRRAEGVDLPVRFVRGNAEELDFPESTFDGCRVERVLQHVANPRQAIAEMVRVSRSGARIVSTDPDYGTMTILGAEAELTRRIVEQRCRHFSNGRVGRDLPGLFLEFRLQRVRVSVRTLATEEIDRATYGQLSKLAGRAEDAGVITATQAQSWLAQLSQAARESRFRYAINVFIVSGRRAC
jgi:SAM-dependent methyltransferase